MKDINTYQLGFNALVGFIGGVASYFFGGWSQSLTWLVIFVVLDYLTGLLVGATGKSKKTEKGGISSYVGFLGIVKKAIIFVVIAVVHGCETFLPGETIIVTQSVTIAFACNEAVSILENVGLLGIDLGPVKQLLEVLKKKSGDEDD